ncbi:SDR family NAD(P)-dependent oxidoreductase [Aeromicrobium sp.]|uniref:SDR family NAD(P)-dependent oxidoreductase n=1 Tax=Aeromicrobium sp. TaxID=1871063 RepID=UPI003D6B859E
MRGRALITGATAGIGNAFARELASRGHDLVIVARNTKRLERVAAGLREKYHVEVDVITADLATHDGLRAAVNALTDTARPVDLLVNNAGSSVAEWFGITNIEDEDHQLDLMVRAPMHLMDAAIKAMTGRGHGEILNVASVAAFTPRGTYSAHKAWIVNLSRWANYHYGDAGVTVMALCPGFVRTEFHQRMGIDPNKSVPRWMWLNADKVVKAALDDLDKRKAVSVPTVRYKILATISQYAPKPLVARMARRGR